MVLKFHKLSLKRVGFLILPLLVIAHLFAVALISTKPVYADTYSPEIKAKAWNVGMALGNCSKGAGWDARQTPADINKGGIFNNLGSEKKAVGYLTEPGDGVIDCGEMKDIVELFSIIDVVPLDFLRDLGIYKLKAGDTAYEIQVSDEEASSKMRKAIAEKFGFSYGSAMPAEMQYASLYASFQKSCAGSEDPNGIQVKIVDNLGNMTTKSYVLASEDDIVVEVGYSLQGDGGAGNDDDDQKMNCKAIVKQINNHAAAYEAAVKKNAGDDDPGNDSPTGPGASTQTENSCESSSGVTSWFMCPALGLIGGALNWVDTQLSRMLEIDRSKYGAGTTSGENLYKAWSQFRNIALALLIAAMLVMVISTALGIGALDAYTVKKAFPRMVASVVFITLSWYICIFLIDISNVVGKGVLGLMTSPFGDQASSLSSLFTATPGGGAVQLGGGLVFAGAAFLIPGATGIILSWIGTGLLVMSIAFLVLVARQMFVIVLVLFAPVAILSWIFPGNDKLWKLWWQSFSKLLLMFPMVMALIASGRIFAGVMAGTDSSGAEGLLNTLLKLTAYILPYAFIPFTFKAAGGVFGNLVGMANDRSRGAFDRLKKGRQKGMSDISKRMAAGQGFRGDQSNILNRGSSRAASGPRGWVSKSKARSIQQGNLMNLGGEQTKENAQYNAWKNDEKFLLAAANEDMAKDAIKAAQAQLDSGVDKDGKALTGNGVDALQNEITARKAALAAAQAIPNRNAAFKRQAALDLAATGYEIDEDQAGYDQLVKLAQSVSGGDQAAYSAFMNSAQFALKGAGRYDMAGINDGAYFDQGKGVSKASLYELANGKGESIKAMVRPGMSSEELSVAHSELKAMLPNAKGGNAKIIAEQIAKLEKAGVEAYNSTPTGSGKQSSRRVDYIAEKADPANPAYDAAYAASWASDPDAQARGWRTELREETYGDLAQKKARGFERPDPNTI